MGSGPQMHQRQSINQAINPADLVSPISNPSVSSHPSSMGLTRSAGFIAWLIDWRWCICGSSNNEESYSGVEPSRILRYLRTHHREISRIPHLAPCLLQDPHQVHTTPFEMGLTRSAGFIAWLIDWRWCICGSSNNEESYSGLRPMQGDENFSNMLNSNHPELDFSLYQNHSPNSSS
jgi:uncharacterized protein (DUF2237 family)